MDSVLRFLFGQKADLFSLEGIRFRFSPLWPDEPAVNLGEWNWLIGVGAVALLLLFIRAWVKDRQSRWGWIAGLAGAALLGLAIAWQLLMSWEQPGLTRWIWMALAAVAIGLDLSLAFLSARRFAAAGIIQGQIVSAGFLFALLSGPAGFNITLGAMAVALVFYVYKHEGRSPSARISLGIVRLLLLALVLALLNNPVLTLTETRTEPSVVAIALDDTRSLSVEDHNPDPKSPVAAPAISRLGALKDLLLREEYVKDPATGQVKDKLQLLRDLNKEHVLRLYRFSKTAQEMVEVPQNKLADFSAAATQPAGSAGRDEVVTRLAQAINSIQAGGQSTQVLSSLRSVLEDLQGQRVAGVVAITDGRSTPAEEMSQYLADLKRLGGKVYMVPVGSSAAPRDLSVESVAVQPDVFVDDIANLTATVRGTGYPAGHRVRVVLKNKSTGAPLRRADGRDSEEVVEIKPGEPQQVELPFKPAEKGMLDVVVEVSDLAPATGAKVQEEINKDNNVRLIQVAVLDAKVTVLYVDGYPRWEYRYLAREMIRDKSVEISCLLISADQGFIQEGDKPITRFPETIQEMLEYDVVLFGDVDPRQFTDRQLQMIHEFVAKKGGGFGMVAGPRWAPAKFRGTPIEAILPVNINEVDETIPSAITVGFRPVLTKEGEASSVFRFLSDKRANEKYLKEDLQVLFWYSRGVRLKPGVGEVYAEHPDVDPRTGKRQPLLVMGRFGAGRTLFSGIDDSWRWRYYTGEQVFDNYWVQQLRYLARSRKLGERKIMFNPDRPVYDHQSQVKLRLRILDPERLGQLPQEISVQLYDEKDNYVGARTLSRQADPELYEASWTADQVGKFTVKLQSLDGSGETIYRRFEVLEPRFEMTDPTVDMTLLKNVSRQTGGDVVPWEDARATLPAVIKSREFKTFFPRNFPVWDVPLSMVLFVLLITAEWVLRKVYGML
jgi:uncharacterized membrane protein